VIFILFIWQIQNGLTKNLQDITVFVHDWQPSCNIAKCRIKLVHQLNIYFMKKTNLLLILLLALSVAATKADAQVIGVGVSIRVGPPAIPVYEQPLCPVDGYLWIPGYWSYGDDGYYWVPGYWSAPPTVGYLWTPGYWGYAGGIYGWNAGYWGPHVGFYGGVNYGFGYGGVGFVGGGWSGGHFRYNTAVMHVNTTIVHNTYVDRTVVHEGGSRVAYNGGPGGVNARPTATEMQAANDHHVAATSGQLSHQRTAGQDRNQYANVNHGAPANAAVARTTAYHPSNAGSLSHSTAVSHPSSANRPVTSTSHTAPAATTANHTTSHTMSRPTTVRHTAPSHPMVQHSAPHPASRAMPHGGGAPHGGGGGAPHGGGRPR
jgi:WXXGXW repeat (2 copies)